MVDEREVGMRFGGDDDRGLALPVLAVNGVIGLETPLRNEAKGVAFLVGILFSFCLTASLT